MMFIAENLKSFRKDKDLTQEEVAERLCVSPQSVSKWERGETLPDITLLPALANLYNTSVDAIIGMDKINSQQTRDAIFTEGHRHIRASDTDAAIAVYSEALKTFPNDAGIMSDLAVALALTGETDKLAQAVGLCERALFGCQNEKTHHTTRAALCFIYLKTGAKDQAIAVAQTLPHLRESRENVLAQIETEQSAEYIDAYLRFVAIGDNDQQDIITVDFGINMIPICTEYDLLEKVKAMRAEIDAPHTNAGHRRLPLIRMRDNPILPPNNVRIRHYTDYLLDTEFIDPKDAT